MSASSHVTTEQLIEIVEPLGQKTKEVVMTEAERLIQRGIERGIEQGIERGARTRSEAIARALLADGMAPEKVANVTGLSLQQVLALQDD